MERSPTRTPRDNEKLFVTLRYVGNVLLIVGYFTILNIDVFWGVCIDLFANAITMPWPIKHKIWDVVMLISFFIIVELHKMSQILA